MTAVVSLRDVPQFRASHEWLVEVYVHSLRTDFKVTYQNASGLVETNATLRVGQLDLI